MVDANTFAAFPFLLTFFVSVLSYAPLSPAFNRSPGLNLCSSAKVLVGSRRDQLTWKTELSLLPSFELARTRTSGLLTASVFNYDSGDLPRREKGDSAAAQSVATKMFAAFVLSTALIGLNPAFAAEKAIPPSSNPYDELQPAGISYLGNRGPNLQVPIRSALTSIVPMLCR
jgi:hypothetical protein